EMARVQEAKEIPSVKVLDAPVVPDRKSFPPRLLIVVIGTLCGAIAGMLWVFSQARWQEIDPLDPGKVFAQEVFTGVAARVPWVSRNGAAEKLAEPGLAKSKEAAQPSAKSAGAGSRG